MNKNLPEIILASGSKYRAELLARLRLNFRIEIPGVSETPDLVVTPVKWAERLSLRKAQSICEKYPDALVIGSDQVAEFNHQIVGKPGSTTEAVKQLMMFSGAKVAFHTGVALKSLTHNCSLSDVTTTWVKFRELNANEVKRYIDIEKPLDCAGSFKCEGLGISLFDSIDSSDPTALIGLPLIKLCSMLRSAGVDMPAMAISTKQ